MTGYELLGMAMRGEIEHGEKFKNSGRSYFDEIKWDGSLFEPPIPYVMCWSLKDLNADWYKVEPKPILDDWEKETCERLLAKKYVRLLRQWDGVLCAYDYFDEDPYTERHSFVTIFDGFDFIKSADTEYVDIDWLLNGE